MKNASVLSRAALLWAAIAGCGTKAADISDANLPGLREVASDVDVDRAMDTVADLISAHSADVPLDCKLLGEDYEPNCHLTNVTARTVIREKLSESGFEIVSQFKEDGVFTSENIIAEHVGVVRPNEVVLVGAHYDAFYAAADDNSSSVASIIELARVLSGREFERTIRFVLFDLEEVGRVGSLRYVAQLPAEQTLHIAVVLDGFAYASSEPNSQDAPPGFRVPSIGNFLAVIADEDSADFASQLTELNRKLDIGHVVAGVAPGDGEYPLTSDVTRSDHASFWRSGLPALFMTDTGNLRNPHYHTDHDTFETLTPAFLAANTRIAAVGLSYWARGPR